MVEAENLKSSEKLSRLPVLDQAKTALKRAENDFDLEWRGEFAGLEEVVMKILAEENADPISAEAEIDRFESNVLPTYRGLPIETELSKIVKDLRNKVLLFQQADFRYIDVTSRVDSMGDDYTRIVAVLAGFSPDFQETRYGPKVKARLDEAYAKYLEIDAAKTDVAALETKKWPMDLYTEWYTPDEGTIVETNKNERWLTLGPNPEGYEDAGTQGSYIAIGDGTWIDVWITTEVKVKDRDKTYLCWGWENHRSQIKMVRAPLEEFEIKDGEWYKFVIKVQTERGAKRFTVSRSQD